MPQCNSSTQALYLYIEHIKFKKYPRDDPSWLDMTVFGFRFSWKRTTCRLLKKYNISPKDNQVYLSLSEEQNKHFSAQHFSDVCKRRSNARHVSQLYCTYYVKNPSDVADEL